MLFHILSYTPDKLSVNFKRLEQLIFYSCEFLRGIIWVTIKLEATVIQAKEAQI